jgi:ketosteroid isomerase-like protein
VQSNAELVREAFAEWNTGDRELFIERIDPDVEINVISLQVTGGEPYRGHEGYWQWIDAMEEAFEVWQLHPETFEESRDSVLVLGSMHLRGRGSGVELDQEAGWIVDARDGRMRRLRTFTTHEEARSVFETERQGKRLRPVDSE